jgi:DNA-binding GntR family transcriptional regulator
VSKRGRATAGAGVEEAGRTRAERGVSAEIAQVLQRRILLGEIPVGSWLRHEALAEEFGTSRTPVREALHVLNAQGIVTIMRNRGAQVNGHSSRDIRELGEVRSELEGFAAELAAERISDEKLERLLGAWRGFQDAIEAFVDLPTKERDERTAARWVEANDEFHSVILEAAGNRQLSESITDIHHRLPRNSSYAAYAGHSRLLQRNLDEHDAIAKAIARHDGVAARRLMTAHIRGAVEATVRWMEDNALVREKS